MKSKNSFDVFGKTKFGFVIAFPKEYSCLNAANNEASQLSYIPIISGAQSRGLLSNVLQQAQ